MGRAGAASSAAVTTYRHTGRSVPSQWFFVVFRPPQRSRGNLWFHNVSDKMTPCLVTLRGAPAKTARVFLSSTNTNVTSTGSFDGVLKCFEGNEGRILALHAVCRMAKRNHLPMVPGRTLAGRVLAVISSA